MYSEEFKAAMLIAKKVGDFLNQQTEKEIISQAGKDIKLRLDREAEKLILDGIKEHYNYPVLSEEAGLSQTIIQDKPYWIVDPIDGSMNFSRGNPSACISIALYKSEEPVFGVIYDFARDELFSGYVGKGAWLNDEPISASGVQEKSQAILATGFPIYMSDDEDTLKDFIIKVQEYKKIRMIGSAALSLAYVACGRFDAYMEKDIKLWDVAAGIAINKANKNQLKIDILDDFTTSTNVGVF